MHEQSRTHRNPYGSWVNSPGNSPRSRLRPKFAFERDFYETPEGAGNAAALRSTLIEEPHDRPMPAVPEFRQNPYGPVEDYLRTAAPMNEQESMGDFDPALLNNPIVRMLLLRSRQQRVK